MAHFLAVTELYVRLTEADRAGTLRLVSFEAEPACWRQFESRTLKPDAYTELGLVRDGDGAPRPYFIEVDRANQYGSKISNKLPQYLSYYVYERVHYQGGSRFPGILFVAPTPERAGYLTRLVRSNPMARQLFRVALFDEFPGVLFG